MTYYEKIAKMSFEEFKKDYINSFMNGGNGDMWYAPYTVLDECDTRYSLHIEITDVYHTPDYDEFMDECPYDEDDDEYDDYVSDVVRQITEAYSDILDDCAREKYDEYCEWVDDLNSCLPHYDD